MRGEIYMIVAFWFWDLLVQ